MGQSPPGGPTRKRPISGGARIRRRTPSSSNACPHRFATRTSSPRPSTVGTIRTPCVGPAGASVARGAAVVVTAGTYRRARRGSMAARRCFADRKRVRGRLAPRRRYVRRGDRRRPPCARRSRCAAPRSPPSRPDTERSSWTTGRPTDRRPWPGHSGRRSSTSRTVASEPPARPGWRPLRPRSSASWTATAASTAPTCRVSRGLSPRGVRTSCSGGGDRRRARGPSMRPSPTRCSPPRYAVARACRSGTSARCEPCAAPRSIDLGMTDRRFGWPLEMVLRAAQAGWRVLEVDVPYAPESVAPRSPEPCADWRGP